jgi:hypothetical protein
MSLRASTREIRQLVDAQQRHNDATTRLFRRTHASFKIQIWWMLGKREQQSKQDAIDVAMFVERVNLNENQLRVHIKREKAANTLQRHVRRKRETAQTAQKLQTTQTTQTTQTPSTEPKIHVNRKTQTRPTAKAKVKPRGTQTQITRDHVLQKTASTNTLSAVVTTKSKPRGTQTQIRTQSIGVQSMTKRRSSRESMLSRCMISTWFVASAVHRLFRWQKYKTYMLDLRVVSANSSTSIEWLLEAVLYALTLSMVIGSLAFICNRIHFGSLVMIVYLVGHMLMAPFHSLHLAKTISLVGMFVHLYVSSKQREQQVLRK